MVDSAENELPVISKKASLDDDVPERPGHAIGLILLVVPISLLMMCLEISDGWSGKFPTSVAILVNGSVVFMALFLSFHVAQDPSHTKTDKLNLSLFFLACYIIAFALLALSSNISITAYSTDPSDPTSTSMKFWEPFGGYAGNVCIGPILLAGLFLMLFIITRRAPWGRPIEYSGMALGIILIVLLTVPFPNTNITGGEWDIEEWPVKDPLYPDRDEIRVQPITYYFWERGWDVDNGVITRVDLEDEWIRLQTSMVILSLTFMSLWSLLEPKRFRRTFGLHIEER